MNRIKELRTKKKIKQVDLARHLGISQSTLSEWESEKYQIDNGKIPLYRQKLTKTPI